jgi:hypothetical protein
LSQIGLSGGRKSSNMRRYACRWLKKALWNQELTASQPIPDAVGLVRSFVKIDALDRLVHERFERFDDLDRDLFKPRQ